MTLSLGLFLICILGLSCLSSSIFKQQEQALAQQYIQTIKYRNLVIDLGNGVKTNAQLTYPAVGKGPFPGVLLIPGSGALDKNGTLDLFTKRTKDYTRVANSPIYIRKRICSTTI